MLGSALPYSRRPVAACLQGVEGPGQGGEEGGVEGGSQGGVEGGVDCRGRPVHGGRGRALPAVVCRPVKQLWK